MLEKYIQQKGLLLQVCAIFKHCLLYQSLLAFIWHVHIYICMFHPDAQPSWLINWTPVDQPAVWMPNPAGPDGGPVVQPCRSSREECTVHFTWYSQFISFTHQAEREGQTKYVVVLPGNNLVV